jgi:flagellar hook-length control protein FliK
MPPITTDPTLALPPIEPIVTVRPSQSRQSADSFDDHLQRAGNASDERTGRPQRQSDETSDGPSATQTGQAGRRETDGPQRETTAKTGDPGDGRPLAEEADAADEEHEITDTGPSAEQLVETSPAIAVAASTDSAATEPQAEQAALGEEPDGLAGRVNATSQNTETTLATHHETPGDGGATLQSSASPQHPDAANDTLPPLQHPASPAAGQSITAIAPNAEQTTKSQLTIGKELDAGSVNGVANPSTDKREASSNTAPVPLSSKDQVAAKRLEADKTADSNGSERPSGSRRTRGGRTAATTERASYGEGAVDSRRVPTVPGDAPATTRPTAAIVPAAAEVGERTSGEAGLAAQAAAKSIVNPAPTIAAREMTLATAPTAGPERIATPDAGRATSRAPDAATGDATRSEVDRVRFVERVSRAFRSAGERGAPLRLRLSPPQLGSLKLEVTLRGGVMAARIETETSEARTLLLENLPALRERLAEHDIKVSRFDVDLGGRATDDRAGQQPGQPGFERQPLAGEGGAHRRRSLDRAPAPAVAPTIPRGTASDGRLNVVI